jgi:glycosyltransferase involved in cell wall biosynthesis
MEASEKAMLRECDLAFAICRELEAKCRRACPESHMFPYGVDLSAFPPPGKASADVPPLIAGLRHPIIGYSGGLHRHVDFDLIEGMARARPAWSWVLAGTPQVATSGIEGLPNVFLAGTVAHGSLHRYLDAFDVCIVPYRHSEFTRTVVPAKVNEYLAAGKPVVSTDLPAVLEFAGEHPGAVVTTAPELPAFLGAIEEALRLPSGGEAALRRRSIAATADWELRIREMTARIEEAARRKSVR